MLFYLQLNTIYTNIETFTICLTTNNTTQIHKVRQIHCSNIFVKQQVNTTQSTQRLKSQENHWKQGMLPTRLLSIKGRSCNQTPLVN